jgi:hypothetical protein
MSTYDPFRFMDDRKAGTQVSEADCNEFQMYNTCRYLSMDTRMRKYVKVFNDIQFQKLPKDLQARAFNTFNGMDLNLRWTRAKTGATRNKEDFIDHMMKITGMSRNCVKAAIRYGYVDKDEIEEAYMRKYEPEKMIVRMQGEERAIKRNIKKAVNLK